MTTVWRYSQEGGDPRVEDEIISSLAGAGIQTVPYTKVSGAGIVICHRRSPDLCDFLRTVSKRGRERVLAVWTDHGPSRGNPWELLHAGVADVVNWDDPEKRAHDIALRFARWEQIDAIIESAQVNDTLVGKSRIWKTALRQIVEVAQCTDASVLITGESGTGKELVARLIHSLDRRERKRDLIVVDCTTIVPALSGSEFFGHERGAFTGAASLREGAFALADGGTLFLDEVGELPPELQAQLLRVVQEGCYKRVGGNIWQKTEFRLVSATNRDLREEVRIGRFRHDLFYRIAGWECRLPPLRERPDDIIPLARHFMKTSSPFAQPPELDTAVEDYLLKRDYPGNVRDLKLLVTRIMYRHVGRGAVTIGDIPAEERPECHPAPSHWCDTAFEKAIHSALLNGVGLKEIGRAAEELAVGLVLLAEEGNLQRSAKRLGITDRALQIRVKSERSRATGEC